jgi:hypothetical protein
VSHGLDGNANSLAPSRPLNSNNPPFFIMSCLLFLSGSGSPVTLDRSGGKLLPWVRCKVFVGVCLG